jgi:hypothetical protein
MCFFGVVFHSSHILHILIFDVAYVGIDFCQKFLQPIDLMYTWCFLLHGRVCNVATFFITFTYQ